jgi:hypothetical protein
VIRFQLFPEIILIPSGAQTPRACLGIAAIREAGAGQAMPVLSGAWISGSNHLSIFTISDQLSAIQLSIFDHLSQFGILPRSTCLPAILDNIPSNLKKTVRHIKVSQIFLHFLFHILRGFG